MTTSWPSPCQHFSDLLHFVHGAAHRNGGVLGTEQFAEVPLAYRPQLVNGYLGDSLEKLPMQHIQEDMCLSVCYIEEVTHLL